MKYICILALLLEYSISVFAQIGGRNIFDFLRLPPNALTAALGGTVVSLQDRASYALQNPAALHDSAHTHLNFSIHDFIGDLSYGTVAYAHSIPEVGNFQMGIQYFHYGTFQGADVFGNLQSTFTANDLAFIVGTSRTWGKFSAGANFKLIHSAFAYQSLWGITVDFGGMYTNLSKGLGIGCVFRNLGFQLNSLAGERYSLPFEILLGISQRVPHTPFRISLTLTNLQQPRLVKNDEVQPIQYDLTGKPIPPPNRTVDNIFRHCIWGLELLLHRNFHIRVSYNHQRRQELKAAEQTFSFHGFSLGAGIKINRFFLDYAYSGYHSFANAHFFTITTSIQAFRKRKGETTESKGENK
ncbi:MAG: type IX secretion system protein PorQ [Bacteroidia bacterium]|nr:type IX secretion system protein PorQ [Bacteroidia bacterium]MDW8159572.1 type IX secretion system protein PorQ [Bacteroidia bacterium]